MMNIKRHTIIEIVIIIVLSTALALFYNAIREGGIPFFPKPKEELLVDDAELFGQLDSTKPAQPAALLDSTITVLDTTALVDTVAVLDTVSVPARDTVVDFDALLASAKRSSFGEYRAVSYEQMQQIAADKSGKFVIVDARRAEPYSKRHIGNAINICPYDSTDIVMGRVNALPSDKIIIVYCDGGDCDSSHEIASILQAIGFTRFYIYEGGWEEWSKRVN